MSGGGGMQPFTVREVVDYLGREHGAVRLNSTGTHGTMRLPSGRSVPVGVYGPYNVTTAVARQIADGLGMSVRELREALGYVRKSGGSKTYRNLDAAAQSAAKDRHCTKAEALAALDDLTAEAERLRAEISCGRRDTVIYDELSVAASAARRALLGELKVLRRAAS